jgi:hypothetical protein
MFVSILLFTGRFAPVYWLVVAGIFVLVVPGVTGGVTKLLEAEAAGCPLAAFAGPEESVCEWLPQPASNVAARTIMVRDRILVFIVFSAMI